MQDQYGRKIDYVRISLTDRCNLRCSYCMPETQQDFMCPEKLMTTEEIRKIGRMLAENGIRKIRLTGGEPLLREDLVEIIRSLKETEGIEQIALTTNGVCLKERMREIAEAGVSAINISLDTTDPERYREIAKRDVHGQVMEGIREALKYPDVSVKLNCVPLCRDRETIIKIAALARDNSLHVRFIEMMPIGYGVSFDFCSEEYIKEVLEEAYGPMAPASGSFGNGPSHYFEIAGFKGKIGFISAVTHKFCDRCNRIRLTADGVLKTCLQYGGDMNIKEMLRLGVPETEIQRRLREEVFRKPAGHHFYGEGAGEDTGEDEKRNMAAIGG